MPNRNKLTVELDPTSMIHPIDVLNPEDVLFEQTGNRKCKKRDVFVKIFVNVQLDAVKITKLTWKDVISERFNRIN